MTEAFEEFDLPEPPAPVFGGDIAFDQAGIDALFGDVGTPIGPKVGVKAIIESDVISHERLPMLEVVYDRMIRTFATSMRNLTSDNIDVSLDGVSSVRFSDFVNRLAQPAMIGVFRVAEWDNYGLITVEPGLIYAIVDALLGGRRGGAAPVIDGRGFTSIETALVSRMFELALADMSAALEPITPNTMVLERVETSPRFATIAGPTNICAVATFRVDMEGRGGKFSILLPFATIEPVRHKLGQRFKGEKLGRDNVWEAHMEAELLKTEVTLDVILGERLMTLQEIRTLAVGQTIAIQKSSDDPLELHCGGVMLASAHVGQRCSNIAVRLAVDISRHE